MCVYMCVFGAWSVKKAEGNGVHVGQGHEKLMIRVTTNYRLIQEHLEWAMF